ncbi:hypothetical protein [Paenibacillus sp. YYML68]|uniref:hypothetical protein n=1 Tax=Paenibacillus sp. YYML68 TaxID=2909250 RepID=UPI0024909408|nr:hypothetical protein [Paenibacillus sp. YYML68]
MVDKLRRNKLAMLLVSAVALATGASVMVDTVQNGQYAAIPALPSVAAPDRTGAVLWALENGQPFDPAQLDSSIQFINARYDTSDFRIQNVLRLLYKHPDKLDLATREQLKDTVLRFKYWMDEPGQDSMCYWSENHQILFAAAQYLAGQLYRDEVFMNSGLTGQQLMVEARERIMYWLAQRWEYGFSEWYSNVYYKEDVAAMGNIIEFAEDAELVTKTSMMMDLLLYDIATQSYKGTMVSTSGRVYEKHKKAGKNASTSAIADYALGTNSWGKDPKLTTAIDHSLIYNNNYEVPPVIKEIGNDPGTAEIKASNGLDVMELAGEGLIGQRDDQIMMQWAMEAFTNPPVITNSLEYIRKNNLLHNAFLHDFKDINYTLLVKLNLLPVMSKWFNPQTNGIAIQRANTYTYRTSDYLMATAQRYHPGEYADQQHIHVTTLGKDVSIFHTHPAVSKGSKSGGSPGYWVGYGRLPDSAQHKNINLSIYVLPDQKGMLEKSLQPYTHHYLPEDQFEQVIIDDRYAFAKHGNTYVALIGLNPLGYGTPNAQGIHDDLLQEGRETFWVTEVGTASADGTLDEFMARIKANTVTYSNQQLTYHSSGNTFRLAYQSSFTINGRDVDTSYARMDSPYAKVPRKPTRIDISYNGKSLHLDFANNVRSYSN